MTDITRLINDLNHRMHSAKNLGFDFLFLKLDDLDVIVGALETLQRANTAQGDHIEQLQGTIHQLESRTVKLPDGWQFEECEAEDCENGAIFSVGTGSRNIHLCDKCAHEPQNSRLKKSPLSKRLPFKMSAGIKVEAE
ncbi:hypothetical protein [Klebsiella pneumoniae]|uniref:hypothetical protein n=1 Tax=Klebsiella pneumoniae TaxID=573 RepID=UPI0009CF2AFD|nr:hypothetical protein [Klebsiella pneumoniae]SLR70769.1 Uncharacterised protein [Klebsiella pneumoniae]